MGLLEGKKILIAGSATGIGAAVAQLTAKEGAIVFLGDINLAGADAVAQQIRNEGGTAHTLAFDLAQETSTDALVDGAVAALGGLDGVANVAADTSPAVLGNDKSLLDLDLSVWDRTLRANLTGVALICKRAIPHLIEGGGGSIVNISSGAAQVGEAERVAYGVSKAGINALTRHIATAYGPKGVRSNAVAPGLVASEQVEASMADEFKAMIVGASPIKRLGRPLDIAEVVAFFLSDRTDWITGQVWSANGGLLFRE